MANAGWYPDAQDPNAQHYFDGENWTGQRRPNSAAQEGYQQPDHQQAQQPPQGQASQGWEQQPQGYQQTPYGGETVRRGDLPADPSGWGPAEGAGQPASEQTVQRSSLPSWAPPAPGGHPNPQGYQQPSGYQQPTGYQQEQPTGYQQPQGGTSSWGGSSWQGQGGTGAWEPTAPPPAKKSRRKPLIIGVVAIVVLAAAGVTAWQLWPSDQPSLTFQGKEIANAKEVLTKAESSVSAAVKQRHGAQNGSTRCYFAKPKKPAKGAKSSDIDNSLRCGPVLFVDGKKGADYLSVGFNATKKGAKEELEASSNVQSLDPAALGSNVTLERPDGKKAPAGDDLSVPNPPPTSKGAVVATSTIPSTAKPAELHGAIMVGQKIEVQLTRAGVIPRYGSGDDARSAASGERLIAFQVSLGAGDLGLPGGDAPELVVDGGTPKPLPNASSGGFIVASVPTSSTPLLVINDGGVKQTLSLPTGKPGASNLAVLRRANRTVSLNKKVNIPVKVTKGSGSGKITFSTTVTSASLHYWAPTNPSTHASGPTHALLVLKASIKSKIFTTSVAPDPKELRLSVPGFGTVGARDADPSSTYVSNVFDVPYNVTSTTLKISGSVTIQGYKLTITKPASVAINFRSG